MKHQATPRFLLAAAALVIAAALAGCGTKEGAKPLAGAESTQQRSGAGEGTADKSEQISVYFTDDDLTDLKEQKAEIRFADDKTKLEAAFAALQASPTDLISLWKHVQLLSVKIEDGAAVFDLHLPNEARLGAPGEDLALQAIEKTMFQFDDVKSIDLLVDGAKVDSLMGHDELDHPIMKP
ncbi:GerMN domain-containing protein [Paenibacillus humicola]|uniref:GerMN domain-containing protein n=1 Tax=Paenibacillus humicola TaxID=3110540 RepID=UPI00237B1A6C|nr:GerMN domain-containing protein [Paenibacillus humicola]